MSVLPVVSLAFFHSVFNAVQPLPLVTAEIIYLDYWLDGGAPLFHRNASKLSPLSNKTRERGLHCPRVNRNAGSKMPLLVFFPPFNKPKSLSILCFGQFVGSIDEGLLCLCQLLSICCPTFSNV